MQKCWHEMQKCVALTHWGRDKMATISQTTFSNAFSWMKMYEFRLKFHWSLSLGVKVTIFQHWFRYGLAPSRRQTVSWTNDVILTHICVTQPHWVNTSAYNILTHWSLVAQQCIKDFVIINSLWPCDAISIWIYHCNPSKNDKLI